MITYHNLMEVFDRAIPYKLTFADKGSQGNFFFYDVPVGKDTLKVTFTIKAASFNVTTNPPTPNMKLIITIQASNNDLRPTGTNEDQFKVYSTVFDIFKKLHAEGEIPSGAWINPQGLTSKQGSVYNRMLKYFVKKNVLVFKEGKYRVK